MRKLRITGLLIAAVGVLMAFVGNAQATTVTSPPGTVYTGSISAAAEGEVVLDNPIAAISCASTFTLATSSHGPGVTWNGPATSIGQTNCTNDWHVTVISGGSFNIHYFSGSLSATVTSSGTTFEATRFGVNCRYATSETHIGTITSGVNSTIHLNGAIPFHSGSFLCGSGSTTWTGSYQVTSPKNMSFD